MFRVALAQINQTVGDFEANTKKIIEYAKMAREEGADIIAFPEMAVTGYPPEDLLHKEHFITDNLKYLRALKNEMKGITAVVGFVDRDGKKNLFNAAAVMSRGKIWGIYHKEALPNYGVFDEKRYFQSGRTNILFSLDEHLIGVSICEDIWVAEGTCQRQAARGAGLLINISSSPYDMTKHRVREELLKRRAVETKAFICYVNLVGGQDELVFDGRSLIVDPRGQVVAAGKAFEEDLIIADIPLIKKKVKKKTTAAYIRLPTASQNKKILLNPLSINKIDPVEGVYKALVLGTRDYVRKNGFLKVIVGLSGGIDSALVATIAADALGRPNVIGVSMPSRYSSKETQEDARRLADNLGIKYKEIPIDGLFKSYLKALENEFAGLAPNITEENIQARIRGNILMALSNKFGLLVLTTGNKSELAVGYCTLYGDMSGGFAVIKDVPKTLVYQLVKFRNKFFLEGVLGSVQSWVQEGEAKSTLIPESIVARPPTAELRENQKDQDVLPPYDELDAILKEYVEEHRSFKQMAKKFDPKVLSKVLTFVDMNEYKRRQAAPGIKISTRAFGKDRRLPITNRYKEC